MLTTVLLVFFLVHDCTSLPHEIIHAQASYGLLHGGAAQYSGRRNLGFRTNGSLIGPAAMTSTPVQFVLLLDVDRLTMPLFLNLLLNLRAFVPLEVLTNHVRVLCMDDESCTVIQNMGFTAAGSAVPAYVRNGYKFMEQHILTTNHEGLAMSHPKGHILHSEQLARELALLQLLGENKAVLRTDSDVCFMQNPFQFIGELQADVITSVQPLDAEHGHGFWAYHWACSNETWNVSLTLNNGVAIIDGSKDKVRRLYAMSVGVGIKLLDLAFDGWAQAGFNLIMRTQGLCLRHSGTQNHVGKLTGSTQDGIRVASMQVCSPCGDCRNASDAFIAHANCLGVSIPDKQAWLSDRGCWRLPSNWSDIVKSKNPASLLGRP